jgi:hypothetical protein
LRRHRKVVVAVASFAAMLVAGREALAAPMDPAPERLYLNNPNLPAGVNCQQVASNPGMVLNQDPSKGAVFPAGATPNQYACLPNNAAWANMMSELGYAIAPTAFHPARTTGFGGFALSLEATFVNINADQAVKNADGSSTQYWHAGTRGDVNPNTNAFSGVNKYPDSILQIYTLKARKGLPFGFEIAGALGYVANTSLWIGGADVHWSVLEGFRTGILGYLPDIAVGGGVRTVGGAPSFFLTTVGIDGQVSKPFTLADSSVLTPYVGAQRIIIFADSTVVNLTPGVDPLANCGYQGNNVPGNPHAPANQPYTGGAICANTLQNGLSNNGDFNNLTTFNKARIHRWKGLAGLTYKYEILYLAGQFGMDLEDPSAENANLGIVGGRQWSLSFEAGVSF